MVPVRGGGEGKYAASRSGSEKDVESMFVAHVLNFRTGLILVFERHVAAHVV